MDRQEMIKKIGETVFYQGSPSKISLQHAEILADFILRQRSEAIQEVVEPLKRDVMLMGITKVNMGIRDALSIAEKYTKE